jgi:hypothetical protein
MIANLLAGFEGWKKLKQSGCWEDSPKTSDNEVIGNHE